MDRDVALDLLEVLTAIKQDLDAIVTNTTPADADADDAEG